MRTLTLAHGGLERPPLAELERLEAANESPRITFYEKQLNSDMLDDRYFASVGSARRALWGRAPEGIGHTLEAFAMRHRYDAVISWGERFGLPMAALLKATGARTPHVALFSWISTPRKAAVLRRVQSRIDRLVLWSSAQYDFAVQNLGIPARRIVQLRWLVDTRFWQPRAQATDTICAVGREMRDYPTLIAALSDLAIPCHLATKLEPAKNDRWVNDLDAVPVLPAHVTVGPRHASELRALYARSRFVVIPLYPTDTDNGVTAMTEAMAMGRPVICSRVAGQRDVLVDGETGLFVPPRDPRALRHAIEFLWQRPDLCEQMGRAARLHVEKTHALERFVSGVRGAVQDAIAEAGDPRAH